MPHPIPDMPGEEAHPSITYSLKEELSKLCGVKHGTRFPGSQPISFTQDHLQLLEKMDFWVCEKSDGLRVMVFIRMNPHTNEQETWLVSIFTPTIIVLRGYRNQLICRWTVNSASSGSTSHLG